MAESSINPPIASSTAAIVTPKAVAWRNNSTPARDGQSAAANAAAPSMSVARVRRDRFISFKPLGVST
jgi:hypothetical protein